ncbi:radical SAM protein [Streptomyces sp. B1866]|uniref:radical SAM protein n=1 Tax=Streptomyces sp. B1866 TaxID=3075431 RepID=UPI00289050ED|nr:radical SAM protein [Streptomyces sp. B1866]MDT3397340.1 radical SAM protein [Streptomyces sp. B1866]
MSDLRFAWLEITGKCQLFCEHCYADSGPQGTHGTMGTHDWQRVIGQLAHCGASMVQFIGGEPTLHPALPELISHALDRGLRVEVFSNLVHVPTAVWPVLERDGVSVATSYYSDDPAEHAALTGRPSHARTKANIAEALARGIPLRAGVIDIRQGQRAPQARQELAALGVQEVRVDRLRQVGRGVRTSQPDASQLCGRCASGVIAISPDGTVWPCVFSRWLPIGNVMDAALADILAGPEVRQVRSRLAAEFAARKPVVAGDGKKDPCDPQCGPSCGPACDPSCWPTGTGPCTPNGGCQPNYD